MPISKVKDYSLPIKKATMYYMLRYIYNNSNENIKIELNKMCSNVLGINNFATIRKRDDFTDEYNKKIMKHLFKLPKKDNDTRKFRGMLSTNLVKCNVTYDKTIANANHREINLLEIDHLSDLKPGKYKFGIRNSSSKEYYKTISLSNSNNEKIKYTQEDEKIEIIYVDPGYSNIFFGTRITYDSTGKNDNDKFDKSKIIKLTNREYRNQSGMSVRKNKRLRKEKESNDYEDLKYINDELSKSTYKTSSYEKWSEHFKFYFNKKNFKLLKKNATKLLLKRTLFEL